MTTFTWTIDDLSRNTDDGGVFTAYWKCVATDGVNTVEASGSQSFIYEWLCFLCRPHRTDCVVLVVKRLACRYRGRLEY